MWLSRALRNELTAGMPSAPWRFSTTTGWPQRSVSRSATRRPARSSTAAGRQRNDEAHGLLRPSRERRLGRRLRVRRPSDKRRCEHQSGGRGAGPSSDRAQGVHVLELTQSGRRRARCGSTSNVMASSSGSIVSGGTTEPVMMISPARRRSPKAASTSATWRTMPTHSPVFACGSVVRANSVPRRMMRHVSPSARGAGPRRSRAAEHHMTLVDVAAQDALGICGRRGEIDDLDRRLRCPRSRPSPSHRPHRRERRGRYGRRFPARARASTSRRTKRFPRIARAHSASRTPPAAPEMLRSCNIAGAPKPTFQPSDWSPASRRLRRASSCACMPRTTRGSSQSFMIIPGWWASLQGSAARSMRLGIDFVARRLDRAGAHPAPHQHDVFVRGVVEAVPAACAANRRRRLRSKAARRSRCRCGPGP